MEQIQLENLVLTVPPLDFQSLNHLDQLVFDRPGLWLHQTGNLHGDGAGTADPLPTAGILVYSPGQGKKVNAEVLIKPLILILDHSGFQFAGDLSAIIGHNPLLVPVKKDS